MLFAVAYAAMFGPQYLRGVYFARIVVVWTVTGLVTATLFGFVGALVARSVRRKPASLA
ncbi:hypothetical protein [Caulobacter sp. 17J65-9]|uniref:hypothetical protein n=1 Tax=Caulobacter sp. 17J65-9 TaxID=2709382 RepID=UPI0013CD26B6|nr:hypothetical protein [Caulobacter sp. 17J65-9]NEX94549.1 hypothetical protein [Caulobacter sp. 17J65-9]